MTPAGRSRRAWLPDIAIICPAHNRSKAIRPTIRSILGQSVSEWELVVVADRCTDDTEHVVHDLAGDDRRVTVVRTPGFGHPSPARRLGLSHTTASVVAYLDHDDTWHAHHLEVVLRLIAMGSDVAATGYTARDDSGTVVRRSQGHELVWHPHLQAMGPLFEPSRVAHRRDLLPGVGGWRVTKGLEDWDLWWRFAQAGHRFSTSSERTVNIHEGKGTRRSTLSPRYWAPALVGSSARTLVDVHRAIESASMRLRLSRAACSDRAAMYRALLADGAVLPAGSSALGQGGDVVAGDGPAYPVGRGRPLAVVPWRGRYALAAPLYCSDEPHADVIRELTVRYSARQRAVLRSLVADLGLAPGVAVVEQEDPSGRRAAC